MNIWVKVALVKDNCVQMALIKDTWVKMHLIKISRYTMQREPSIIVHCSEIKQNLDSNKAVISEQPGIQRLDSTGARKQAKKIQNPAGLRFSAKTLR